ncbi:hypothetical protein WJX84_011386 [Apatococcus fuscideae]
MGSSTGTRSPPGDDFYVTPDSRDQGGASPSKGPIANIWEKISSSLLRSSSGTLAEGISEERAQGDLIPSSSHEQPTQDSLRIQHVKAEQPSLCSTQEAQLPWRPLAGTSLRGPVMEVLLPEASYRGESTASVSDWSRALPNSFNIRGKDYLVTKQKESCAEAAIYRLIGVDLWSFKQKVDHIGQYVQLPKPPELGPGARSLPEHECPPPFLIINVQLPLKPAALFGKKDEAGSSLVYYFALPEGWEPEQLKNPAALALLQRFILDQNEQDSLPTRTRLKLIPRISNVAEWATTGPLNGAEHRLLDTYNDKPVLTKPQHAFYNGADYFEIDLNIHGYAYVARKAFGVFIPRLPTAVFENAFVIQGNRPEELPELLLGCVKMSYIDFNLARPFPYKAGMPSFLES